MADRLSIYNGSLRLIGDARLDSLTEAHPARSSLDDAWVPSVTEMLEAGMWNFAIRAVELSHDENVEPRFGYQYAFSKPADYVRLVGISQDASFRTGFEHYEDETGHWHADIDPLYLRYVSNHESYGWNVGAWRQSFSGALEALLAFNCGLPISGDRGNRNDMYQLYQTRLAKAKTLDAVDERVRFQPVGRLVRSRVAGSFSRRG